MIKKLVSHLGEYKRAAVLTPLFAALEACLLYTSRGRGHDAGKRRHPLRAAHGAAVPRCPFRHAVHRRCLDVYKRQLQGKVALITGGAHGIGFSIAEGMAKCGAAICCNCSSEASLEKGLAAYKAVGIDAHGYVADVSDEDAVNAMVAKIKAEVGPVDKMCIRDSGGRTDQCSPHPGQNFQGRALLCQLAVAERQCHAGRALAMDGRAHLSLIHIS